MYIPNTPLHNSLTITTSMNVHLAILVSWQLLAGTLANLVPMLSLLQVMEAGRGLGTRQHVAWKTLTVCTLSLTDTTLDVFGYLVMTIFRWDPTDGQLLSSERGYHQHVGTMLDEELYTGKMTVLGCHNQWSLEAGKREEREEGERREREESNSNLSRSLEKSSKPQGKATFPGNEAQ